MTWGSLDRAELVVAGVTEMTGVTRVPVRQPDGSEHNAKLFPRHGRPRYEVAGREQLPFGLETVTPGSSHRAFLQALLVVEGEKDALAARAAYREGDQVVATYYVLGIPGAGAWRSDWRRYLEPFDLIYLLGDGDEAGQRMNRAIARDLPWARMVRLPDGEDVRSLLQQRGREALDELLDEADDAASFGVSFFAARSYTEFVALRRGQEIRRAA